MTETVGYEGCSNTQLAVDGYHTLGGTKLWPALKEYGGGTISRWQSGLDSGKYWTNFDQALSLYGADRVWLVLCAKEPVTPEDLYAAALAVIDRIRARPQTSLVPIEASAINGYEPGWNQGVAWQDAQAAVDMLVVRGQCSAGPVLPILGQGTTRSDHTHPNKKGQLLLGQALLDWYG